MKLNEMKVDGQCHCGSVIYQAEIDPEKGSICHCTDYQSLTGSPFQITVICSGEQIRMTRKAPKIYAKTNCRAGQATRLPTLRPRRGRR